MNIYNYKFIIQLTFTILFLLPLIYPVNWTGNEFNYFGIAKHTVDPNPYSQLYASYNEQLSRFLSDYTIGSFIKLFGADNAWVILRLAGLIGISLAFVFLCRTLEIALVPSVFALFFFKKLEQTYFGGEWIFYGIEPKVFSYIFVFFGLAYAIKNKLSVAVIFLSLATYFHFLVGGFWGLATFIYILIDQGLSRDVIRNFIFFIISIIPLLFLLVYENLRLPPEDINGLGYTVDQIYSNIRNPHHVAPFVDGHIGSKWVGGLFLIVLDTIILYAIYSLKLIKCRDFVLWLILFHIYLLLAVLLAFFDRDTQYFGKFYLFRPSSLILLLTLLIYCNIILGYLTKIKILSVLFPYALTIFIVIHIHKNISLNALFHVPILYDSLKQDEKDLVFWLRNNTKASDVILFEEGNDEKLAAESFELIVERPSLVNWKFVTTTKYSIARWYRLVLLKRQAYSGECSAFDKLSAKYYITYSVSGYENISRCAETVFSIGKYHVAHFPVKYD